jgi:alpha-beta hydrolase superfamily lysophospholipase
MTLAPLDTRHLPAGVHSRFVENVNGLRMHVLEAGDEKPDQPLLLLLHGFPELAYSWRKVMVPLAELGYHVVAPATAAPQAGAQLTTRICAPTRC